MADTIEVTAEVVGEEIVPAFTPAVIDAAAYLDDRKKKIDAHMEPYVGLTEDALRDLDKREVYNLRADVNKAVKAMRSELTTIKKEHMKPFDAFKAQADEIIKQAVECHALLDDVYKRKESQEKEDRTAQLRDEFEGCAGVLTGIIPFEAILDPKWLGDTAWKSGKPFEELQEAVVKAAEGYETLQAKELKHKGAVIRCFCETLDVLAALQREDELNEEDRRRAEFEERQRQVEEFKAERQAQRAETEAEAYAPEPPVTDEPKVFMWHLDMTFDGTRQFAQSVAMLLKSNGIEGATIKCIKEASND